MGDIMDEYPTENAIAKGDRWTFASATAFQREGINVYRKSRLYDGKREKRVEWWVRCEDEGEPPQYRLAHTFIV
jgi:hypothetical protein